MKINKAELQKIIRPIVEETVRTVVTEVLLESFAKTVIDEVTTPEPKKAKRVKKKRSSYQINESKSLLDQIRTDRDSRMDDFQMSMDDDFETESSNPVQEMLTEMGVDNVSATIHDNTPGDQPSAEPVDLSELAGLGIDMNFGAHVDKLNKKQLVKN